MSIISVDYGNIGGGIEPLVFYARGGNNFCQCAIKQEIINKYKYIKLMTQAEYATYLPDITFGSSGNNIPSINTTSVTAYYNDNGTSYTQGTLSTTDVATSSLNLDDKYISYFLYNGSGIVFAVMLHN